MIILSASHVNFCLGRMRNITTANIKFYVVLLLIINYLSVNFITPYLSD
jgi:hypothetical protein